MKEVELFRIVHSDQSPECQMYLREKERGRVFPVIIAMNEMAEIHRKVHGIATRRPMTHDIFAALMKELRAELRSVEITELKDDVFYARMRFHTADGRDLELDARPSDAVAIATGVGARIFVADGILDEIGIVEEEGEPGAEGEATGEAAE
jgi:bifunctional DNase/RNase